MLPYILRSIKQLECSGADFIILPCNTLHSLVPQMRKNTAVEIIDLVEEVTRYVKNNHAIIGILSTNKTRSERLYDSLLKDVEVIYPSNNDQIAVSEIIIRIIRGNQTEEDYNFLSAQIQNMINLGAEKVILACTDIANLIKNNPHTIDSTDILIKMIIRKMNDL